MMPLLAIALGVAFALALVSSAIALEWQMRRRRVGAPIHVHILWHGHALCGFMSRIVPAQWPAGNLWTHLHTRSEATCPKCRRVAGVGVK